MGSDLRYLIRRTATRPPLDGDWDGPVWSAAETLKVQNFLAKSSDHRPRTRARLLHDAAGIYGIFRVQDKYVRCVRTEFYQSVCKDSCVEFFVRPKGAAGYFNFEFNCGGTFLFRYQGDRSDPANTIVAVQPAPEEAALIQTWHSMPSVVDPEIAEDTEWFLQFAIPFAVFENYLGPLGDVRGQEWRANFYKCGDETSHPHWATWAPLDQPGFHAPRCFAPIVFD